MSRELDRRDHTAAKDTPQRKSELRSRASEASDRLAGAHRLRIARFDAGTGNPAVVTSVSAPAEQGNFVARALDHVQGISPALGLSATQPLEYVPDPHYQTTSSGAVAVHLQQRFKGILIFQAAETVRFAPNGTLTETAGRSVTVTYDRPVEPRLTVQEAVLKAVTHIAIPHEDEIGKTDQFGESLEPARIDLADFYPEVLTSTPRQADRPTVLEGGPFAENIKANLIWFDLDEDLRLAWEVLTTMPGFGEQYRTFVDAETGEILYCRQLIQSVASRGNIYRVDGSGSRTMTDFPIQPQDYELPVPADLPSDFPRDWVQTDESVGNSVRAHLGSSGPTLQGTVQGGVLTFDPADPDGDEQKILNIFYYNCYMHDFFYMLGFREAQGNFQQNNFGLGGTPSDRVDARAHSGPVYGTANMGTPVDGLSPVMNMGLVSGTGRHTAFDSSVVFHEFMHGVTNRLVGGPNDVYALEAVQSGGMGEGWGDYIACTINQSMVVGDWVTNNPGGIRGFPYTGEFPDHFGALGTGRYNQVHDIGEIWCATLLEMNRRIGRVLGVQLVVDALMLSPSNPSFLDMRDAIFSALDNRLVAGQLDASAHTTARAGIWGAFAKFGMGVNASSNGASLSGIVADFTVPEDETPDKVVVSDQPEAGIPDNTPDGVESTLVVDRAGRVDRVVVSIDIRHSWIGDLVVTLITPAGTSVVLHERAGGSADNLIRSYSSDDFAALTAIMGESVEGTWKLKVADLATEDIGTLKSWGLEIELDGSSRIVQEEAFPALKIPDDNPTGIQSSLAVSESGTIQSIAVEVDITHTYIGDLRVELDAPSGQNIVLHNRAGGWTDNLIAKYESLDTPALATLAGSDAAGQWTLRVRDLAGQDVGKLNGWRLTLGL